MIKIGNAPCSWGVLEFDLDGKAPGYEQVLNEMQQTGYAGTELGDWGFMPTDPQRLRAELDARGLSLLSAFVPVQLKDSGAHAAGVENAVRTARLLAAVQGHTPFIVLADDNGKDPQRTRCAGRITAGMGLSAAEWQTAAKGAEAVARAVFQETGLRTVVHHHCAGYVETPAEISELLARTDPALVGLCLDTGHYLFGGGDPLSGLRQHAQRIWHVHFKDCHPAIAARSKEQDLDYFGAVRAGVFCELGQGEIDFATIKAELDKLKYDGWIVVEQDVLPGMGTPKASAQRNRDFLKSIGL
jgi:inosose dehydratase